MSDAPRRPEADREAHARIAEALAGLVPPGGSVAPHPYLRRHLARHAALAGALDDRHVPPWLLPWETDGGIRALLGRLPDDAPGRAWLAAWAAIEPYAQQADEVSRRASLHLAFVARCFPRTPASRLPGDAAVATPVLRVLWSQWSPPAGVLATFPRTVTALAAVPVPGGAPLLAAGDDEGGIELVDTGTGAGAGERITAHRGAVTRLRYLPQPAGDGWLLSGSADATVRVWDAGYGTPVGRAAAWRGTWTADVVGYPDGDGEPTVLAVSGEGESAAWHPRRHRRASRPAGVVRRLAAARAGALAALPGDGRPVLAAAGSRLLAWDAATGRALGRAVPVPGGGTVRALAATTLPDRVAAVLSDGTAALWRPAGGGWTPLRDLTARTTALAGVRSGHRHLVASAGDGTHIDVSDARTGERTTRIHGHGAPVTALCPVPGPDGELLASAAADGTVRLWDATALSGAGEDHGGVAAAALHAADEADDTGPLLAVGDVDGRVRVWNVHTGARAAGPPAGPYAGSPAGGPGRVLAWSTGPGGRRLLLSADAAHALRAWEPESGRRRATLRGHLLPVRALAVWTGPGGEARAVSGGDDATVRTWDVGTGRQLSLWRHAFGVRAVAAGTDREGGVWLVSGGADGTLRLRRPGAEQPGAPLTARQGIVTAVAVDARPAGALPPLLVSGGDDGTVRRWDLLRKRPFGEPLRTHRGPVSAVAAWTADGVSYLAAGGGDGTVRVWHAASGRCLLELVTGGAVHTLTACPGAAGPGRVALTMAGDPGVAVAGLDLGSL
ncbi:WD40 repeat domain-containing protein [Streptomyces sp. JJ36]|uniref:WD40 repeat domain-containing protein n=1 Tax=Streptomyces sp. JJ36 TaxID=2736645 RepID=UPI001F31F36A|nr:WD40 repeat domain-containing protein [Streptomyces sp. JJ36]MCF6525178.1 hypothetical protein [Streptomyces sp. JJ36]